MPLIYETRHGGSDWRQMGTLAPNGGIGSISHIGPDDTREVIIFGCNSDDETSTIAIVSQGSMVTENDIWRRIDTTGVDVVATLADGEEFEMPVMSSDQIKYDARWRHEK